MLKLGLKKKKKGKKSKKDQELFTEEELKQYKLEHQQKAQQQQQESELATAPSETERKNSVGNNLGESSFEPQQQYQQQQQQQQHQQQQAEQAQPTEQDDEWKKFKALTAGVDSILHRTQDDLDRIKSTSFFQKVPTAVEKQKLEEEELAAREAERLEKERLKKLEEEANRDKLAEAVVELSESEEESEEVDDIFNTEYIDAITSGEIQLTVVPDSPEFEVDTGPDPFDTAYADKLIKGPEVSKTGRKLVGLGSAVQVLTGRVDAAHAVAVSGAKRKPRKGVQDLLFENEEDAAYALEELPVTPEPTRTLLDDFEDNIGDFPIDLSAPINVSLLQSQSSKGETFESNDLKQSENGEQVEKGEENKFSNSEVLSELLSEFDVLKKEDDDEFAELALESLVKKEEVKVITHPLPINYTGPTEENWAIEFEADKQKSEKAKPSRPPPPTRPATGPHIKPKSDSDDEFDLGDDDPFDTAFVEKVIPAKDSFDDDDFDPRAGEEPETNKLKVVQKDLLGGSATDLSKAPHQPIEPVQKEEEEFDPFDTSAVVNLVKPKEVELKVLEKELLSDQLKKSLSDPDFDPRADEPELTTPTVEFDPARRKSSLSLNLHKAVGFLVPETDLLAVDHEGSKIQKPLTPYYAKESVIEEKEVEDPFDTSFVSNTQPSEIELKHLEKDLLATSLKHSISDPDFDPRATEIIANSVTQASDLLDVQENIDIKVLTPAHETKKSLSEDQIDEILDPFDTSIASNIQPGKTELKLLENELLPQTTPEITTGVLDSLTDAQELGLGDKVLTPQISLSEPEEEIDPFDTSFAANLAPGQTEIKLLEKELIKQ